VTPGNKPVSPSTITARQMDACLALEHASFSTHSGCMLVVEPMAQPYLRLRQIALVARALEPIERQLTSVLATEVCFRDPGVGKYGLHNALWALGGTFLEVVAPIRDSTAAGRYLDRRGGDGGYMCILDCDDLDARRAQLRAEGLRVVEDVRAGDAVLWSEAIHRG
jgi:hypothetical protein